MLEGLFFLCRLDLNSSPFGFREICLPNDLRFSFSMLHCSSNHGFSLCFLVVLLNLKPACLHISVKFCVNRSVIVSTLLLFSAVFSLLFVSILSKSRLNSCFALSSQTNFLNSLNVISSDRFPGHLFCCFSINANERGQWSDRWGSRSLTIKIRYEQMACLHSVKHKTIYVVHIYREIIYRSQVKHVAC